MEIREVVAAGPGWTQVRATDGNTYTLSGTRNWRNNNPGNLEYGDFAKSKGAIGTDGRFAVFPSYDAGRQAKSSLLFESPKYADKTIAGAISRYAPSFENNTQGYYGRVARDTGVSADTPISSLNDDQRSTMLDSMQRVEGYREGKVKDAYGNPVSAGLLTSPQAQSSYGIMSVINPATPTPVQRASLLDAAPATGFDEGRFGPKPNMQTVPDLKYDRFAAPQFDQARFADPAPAATSMNSLRRGLLDQQLDAGELPSLAQPAYAAMAAQTIDPGTTAATPGYVDPQVTTAGVQAPAVTRPAMSAAPAQPSPQQMAQAGILAAGPTTPDAALGARVERELSNRKLAGTLLGGVLGGGLLGPLGGLVGGYLGRQTAAKTYFPEAPKPDPEKQASQSKGNGGLTSYGKSVANSSNQFSRALASGGKGLY
jgi:hypothetical protein